MKRKKKFSFALFYQKFGVLTLLVILFAVASIISPNFLKTRNLINILRQIVIITIIACGACFILICGQINIAYDGLIACVGCTSCMIMVATNNAFLSVVIGLAMGGVVGYIYGVCVTVLKVPSFLVSLAITSVASGGIMLATGGTKVRGMGDSFTVLGKGSIGPIPVNVLIMFACIIICHVLLTKSTFGRRVLAVGGNREAAIASGINADSVLRRVFVLDGITTALAAILFMARLGNGQPDGGKGYAFDAVTGAIVGGCSIYGGKGTVIGCLVGAGIVGVLKNILNLMNVNSYWQDICSGAVILLAVLIDLATKEAATNATKNQMAEKKENA